MNSTMQDSPLSITELFRHGAQVYPDSEIITFEGEQARHTSYAKVAERVNRLAGALRTLGIVPGDRVGTLSWNHQEHMEAYFAIPCMGAVLHTLNLRLPPPQLAQIINHAEDRVVIVDDSLAKKYLGQDKYPFRQPGEVRVIFKVQPEHTTSMG